MGAFHAGVRWRAYRKAAATLIAAMTACSSPGESVGSDDGGGGVVGPPVVIPTGSGVESVSITAAGTPVEQQAVALTATVTIRGTPRVATPNEVRWTVVTPGAGDITAEGQFTPSQPGAVDIRLTWAADSTKAAVRTLQVDSAAIVSISLLPISGVIPGDTIRPQVVARDAVGRDRRPAVVAYRSLDATFAAAGTGAFRAQAVGTGQVEATAGALVATVSVPVALGEPASLSSAAVTSLEISEMRRFAVATVDRRGNALPNASPLVVTSRSPSTVSVATVSDSAQVTGVSAGTAWVVIARGAVADSMRITVSVPPIARVVATAVDARIDWARGGRVKLLATDTRGGVVPIAGAVTMTQIAGTTGLVGWTNAADSIGEVRTLLPPTAGGVRRDVGATARVVFRYQTFADTLTLALHYRRPVSPDFPGVANAGGVTIDPGATVQLQSRLVDSAGNVLAPTEVFGTLSAPTSSAPTVATVSAGGVVTAVASGSATITQSYVEAGVVSRSLSVTVPAPPPPAPDLTPIGTGYVRVIAFSSLRPAERDAIAAAVARVEGVIAGSTAPGHTITLPVGGCIEEAPAINNETITGVLIHLGVRPVDGPNGALAAAGPCVYRAAPDRRPAVGIAYIDEADIARLAQSGQLTNTVSHELLHVLGIGTMWYLNGYTFVPSPLPADPTYSGAAGNAAYAVLGGAGQIPIENTGGGATAGSHWRETVFRSELMTGFLSAGTNPLSRVTIGALADLGYTVNYARAEPYTLGQALRDLETGLVERGIALGDDVIRPRFTLDSQGRLIRLP